MDESVQCAIRLRLRLNGEGGGAAFDGRTRRDILASSFSCSSSSSSSLSSSSSSRSREHFRLYKEIYKADHVVPFRNRWADESAEALAEISKVMTASKPMFARLWEKMEEVLPDSRVSERFNIAVGLEELPAASSPAAVRAFLG